MLIVDLNEAFDGYQTAIAAKTVSSDKSTAAGYPAKARKILAGKRHFYFLQFKFNKFCFFEKFLKSSLETLSGKFVNLIKINLQNWH